jgi:hypothetical protein
VVGIHTLSLYSLFGLGYHNTLRSIKKGIVDVLLLTFGDDNIYRREYVWEHRGTCKGGGAS